MRTNAGAEADVAIPSELTVLAVFPGRTPTLPAVLFPSPVRHAQPRAMAKRAVFLVGGMRSGATARSLF